MNSSKQNRLSKKQIARIRADQEKQFDNIDLNKGLVLSKTGTSVLIECQKTHERISCKLRRHLNDIVCGDIVLWEASIDEGIIYNLCPRKSLLSRRNQAGKIKNIAANVTQVVITLAIEPAFSLYLLDSYLIACESLGIKALIICNKIDLIDNNTSTAALDYYRELHYPVIELSLHAKIGIEQLKAALNNQTSVLVGQSGVGKSSLINALLPKANAKIQTLSNSIGKHTTSQSHLYHIGETGIIIDSPGVQEFGLSYLPIDKIAENFIEFRNYLGRCQFRNCRHEQDPGCALLAAVSAGKIATHRIKHYHLMTQKLGQKL